MIPDLQRRVADCERAVQVRQGGSVNSGARSRLDSCKTKGPAAVVPVPLRQGVSAKPGVKSSGQLLPKLQNRGASQRGVRAAAGHFVCQLLAVMTMHGLSPFGCRRRRRARQTRQPSTSACRSMSLRQVLALG